MGTFLSVLKIIGIVLLCILAFLVVLLLLILFVPYRYKVYGEKKERIGAYAKVTWLLHFVVVLLTYDDGINLRIKILGIPFYDKKKKAEKARLKEEKARLKEREKARKEKEKAEKNKKADEVSVTEETGDSTEEQNFKDAGPEEEKHSDTERDKEAEDSLKESEASDADEKAGKKKSFKDIFKKRKKKQSFTEWLEDITDKISDLLFDLPDMIEAGGEALFEKLEKIRDKISGIIEKIEYYHRLLTSEGAEWVYEYVKKHLIAILKAARPTRFDAEVNIADDDPANVAKVYEYEVYALPFIELIRGRRGKVIVNAYQDEKFFDMQACLKGRILLFPIAIHGLALLLNKKVRYFIKKLKREDEAEDKKNG